MALRADWQAQLRRCHKELGFRHVRFHGLLGDDIGILVATKDRLLYSFFNADKIVDFLLSIGMKPFVELSFMPEALASGHTTVFHYRANVTPPKDYEAWAALIDKLVRHWVERYGLDEVRTWPFEVWNEPNLKQFWTGTQEDYFNLYRHTAKAIKAIDDGLKVGGPSTAKNAWIEEFLDYCDREKLLVDFVSTHHYPNDVLAPDALPDLDDDTEMQLAHGPRGIMRAWTQEARLRTDVRPKGYPLYYTEWNTSSNPRFPLHDEPYAAAFATKTIMEASGLVDCYSFWTFTDLFEENYFPSVPFHGGFGLLNLHGIPKPTYRAFELLQRLGNELLGVTGNHPTVDTWVVRKKTSVTVLLTNHALPRHPIREENVRVTLTGATKPRHASLARIDARHANAKRAWKKMGSPEYLNPDQIEELNIASRVVQTPLVVKYSNGSIHFDVSMPPHAVAAIKLNLGAP